MAVVAAVPARNEMGEAAAGYATRLRPHAERPRALLTGRKDGSQTGADILTGDAHIQR
jgi:hypothetical protein